MKTKLMETQNIIILTIAIVAAIGFILFLMRRNKIDEEDTDPTLTKAFEDEKNKPE